MSLLMPLNGDAWNRIDVVAVRAVNRQGAAEIMFLLRYDKYKARIK